MFSAFSPNIQSPFLHMAFHVEGEMVGPGEGALTQVALEGSVSGVLAEVTGQFIRTGKLPSATFPIAMVRLLACMRSVVRLQVRTFCVGFATSRKSASVSRRPFPWPGASSPLWFGIHLQRR